MKYLSYLCIRNSEINLLALAKKRSLVEEEKQSGV